jgi:hypothetical protein
MIAVDSTTLPEQMYSLDLQMSADKRAIAVEQSEHQQ